jgi:hypothetical protein
MGSCICIQPPCVLFPLDYSVLFDSRNDGCYFFSDTKTGYVLYDILFITTITTLFSTHHVTTALSLLTLNTPLLPAGGRQRGVSLRVTTTTTSSTCGSGGGEGRARGLGGARCSGQVLELRDDEGAQLHETKSIALLERKRRKIIISKTV